MSINGEYKRAVTDIVDDLTVEFKTLAKGGFTLNEILRFTFRAGMELVAIATEIDAMTIAAKKVAITQTLRDIYFKVNPDIPKIPEPFESWLEDIVFNRAVPILVEVLLEEKIAS